ncbi:unnamed protein product [Pleuronectes platessa]|uniref:Uncharacterized protein n=1 Tax=Pleuronectes platessa TaxID=8262 RepID=A0A9N7VQ03_PLEPL|nr:unnamed protein product [Pleuronectes platessa]
METVCMCMRKRKGEEPLPVAPKCGSNCQAGRAPPEGFTALKMRVTVGSVPALTAHRQRPHCLRGLDIKVRRKSTNLGAGQKAAERQFEFETGATTKTLQLPNGETLGELEPAIETRRVLAQEEKNGDPDTIQPTSSMYCKDSSYCRGRGRDGRAWRQQWWWTPVAQQSHYKASRRGACARSAAHRDPPTPTYPTTHRAARVTYLSGCPGNSNSSNNNNNNKNPRVIRGERGLVSALPDPAQGFVNYSSPSHLSLAKTDPARRPDIPRTTNSPQRAFYVAQRHMAVLRRCAGLCSSTTPSQTAARDPQLGGERPFLLSADAPHTSTDTQTHKKPGVWIQRGGKYAEPHSSRQCELQHLHHCSLLSSTRDSWSLPVPKPEAELRSDWNGID